MNEPKNICGGNIREVRRWRGMTQVQLAGMMCCHGINMSGPMISSIERGRLCVWDRELFFFCTVLEVVPNDLLDG